MFEKLAQSFMDRCYLSGSGTHERIVREMADVLRSMAWFLFLAGLMVGGVGGYFLCALLMKGM